MPENTSHPFRGFFAALEAMKKIDAICGDGWDGDEEAFSTNPELREFHRAYLEGMREFRRGFGPDLVLGGANESLIDILREFDGMRDLNGGAREYIQLAKETAENFGNEDAVDIFDNLLSLKYFSPDEWFGRLGKKEMGPLLVKSAGIPDWLHKRYIEAAYAYVYGFFNASVALCRSIIEGVLKNKLEAKGIPIKGKTLEDLLGFARKAGVAGDHAIWFGDFVRQMGNSVLHETCASRSIHAKKALNVIGTTKEFIEHMY